MWSKIKIFILWLIAPLMVWMIAFPNGTGGYTVEILSAPFDNGTVVCTTQEDEIRAEFKLNCRCTYGAFETKKIKESQLLTLRVYKLVDDGGERVPTKDYSIAYDYAIEGNPAYLKKGQDFTLNVALRFDESVPSGAYTVAIHTMHAPNEVIYEDALIVP